MASIMNFSWDTGAASLVRSQTEKQKHEIETSSGYLNAQTPEPFSGVQRRCPNFLFLHDPPTLSKESGYSGSMWTNGGMVCALHTPPSHSLSC